MIEGTGGGRYLGSGGRLAGVGDTDGDGCSEVVVYDGWDEAAFWFDGATVTSRGTLDTTDNSGSVSPALGDAYPGPGGDLDGDGRADTVVGLGPSSGASTALDEVGVFLGPWSSARPDMTLSGEAPGDHAQAPAVVGDVDGDGSDDLLVGAYGYASDTGRVYLVSGPPAARMSLADAEAVYDGATAGEQAGYTVAPAGDENGDGYADFLIGAPARRASVRGAVYLVLGPAGSDADLGSADAVLLGESRDGYLGGGLAAGDADGDGFSDVLLTSNETNSLGFQSTARFAYGPLAGTHLFASVSYALEGGEFDGYGRSVAMSDVDGNGTDDLLFATEDGGSRYATGDGQTFLFTQAPTAETALFDADAVLSGTGYSPQAWYVGNPGDVNGDGYGDVMVGAPGVNSGSGAIYLLFGTGL